MNVRVAQLPKIAIAALLLIVNGFWSPAKAFELKVNITIFDKETRKKQRTSGVVVVDLPTEVVSGARLLTRNRSPLCSGTRKVLVARENFLSGNFVGSCFGFKARGKWSQVGVKVKFRWDFNGSWIETR